MTLYLILLWLLFSQQVSQQIEEELGRASQENQHVAGLMTELGVNPRPTVAQWLQRKQQQKKAELQGSLITWDRGQGLALLGRLVGETGIYFRLLVKVDKTDVFKMGRGEVKPLY